MVNIEKKDDGCMIFGSLRLSDAAEASPKKETTSEYARMMNI